MSPAATLIVPVENQTRELDAKLLLSCVAAERGFPVVLGSRTFIHLRVGSLPRGVYLAKSMRSLSDRMFDILRKLGHEIVGLDEEALVRPPDAQYWERRLSPNTVQKVSALLAWGPDDARVFREYPGYAGAPIHITGNPRVDMMRRDVRSFYAEEARGIRERFGPFVLINTNFGWSNHFLPDFTRINEQGRRPDEFMSSLFAHREALFQLFQVMVHDLAKALPGRTVLVRPHPTESHAVWNEIGRVHDNVRVASEGSVIPWLLACDALVHNSCTTAIEAYLLERPAIAYQPVSLEDFDDELPNVLSHRVSDTDALVEAVGAAAAGRLRPSDSPERRRRVARHIAALEGPLASERIVDVLEQAGYGKSRPPAPGALPFAEARVHALLRGGVKRVNMRRRGHRNSLAYHTQRFPDVSPADLRTKVERLGRELGRFEAIRIRPLSRHLFQIES